MSTQAAPTASSSAGPRLELENDHFWSIPFTSLHRMEDPPTDLTIGQLSESIEWLAPVVDGTNVLDFGLARLGDLIRAIGGQVGEAPSR